MSRKINRYNARKRIKIMRTKTPITAIKRNVVYKNKNGYVWNPITFDFSELENNNGDN